MTAALVARLWVDTSGVDGAADVWFPPIEPAAFAATLAVAAAGAALGRLLRLPAALFPRHPVLVGTLCISAAVVGCQLPPWLLALSYAMIGWSIGLNFTRPILRHAARALPQILLRSSR